MHSSTIFQRSSKCHRQYPRLLRI